MKPRNDPLSALAARTAGMPACETPGRTLELLLQETTLARPDPEKRTKLGVNAVCEILAMLRRTGHDRQEIEDMIRAGMDRLFA